MKRIVAVGIAGLGLAVGLLRAEPVGSAGRPLPDQIGKVLTIRQGSRPPEQFVTVLAWERPDKTVIRYIRSQETQEMATLVEPPGSSQAQLYRWGVGQQKPPPGVPTIPDLPATPAAVADKPSQAAKPSSSPSTSWQPAATGVCPSPASGASVTASPTQQPSVPSSRAGDGLAGGTVPPTQQTSPPSSSTPVMQVNPAVLQQLAQLDRPGEVITLDFRDRGVQRCVILRKTVDPNGVVTLTVRSESTGEVMTVTTAPVAAPSATLVPMPTASATSRSDQVPSTPAPSLTNTTPAAETSPSSGQPSVVLVPQASPRESLWSRIVRRISGSGTSSPRATTGPSQEAFPTPVLAPPPRMAEVPPAPIVPGSETRIIVGPVPSDHASAGVVSEGGPSRSAIGPKAPLTRSESTSPARTEAQPPASSVTLTPGTNSSQAVTGQHAVQASSAEPEQRRGLFNRLFRRDSDRPANKPGVSHATTASLTPEQLAAIQYQFAVLAQASAVLPVKRAVPSSAEPPVPFPPPLATGSAARKPNTPAKPDPLREPEKFVQRNPIRETVTNASLTAGANKPASSTLPEPPSRVSPPTPSGPVSSTSTASRAENQAAAGQTGITDTATSKAPVPLPFVPMVTDKPRPDLPPPQPPIQPFNTLQVAAVQNPHQFPGIVPPVVPSRPDTAATPVAWTTGPLVPPHQSPVQTLTLQASANGTEALALRNTLFLVNVLQTSGSPQQREWAAARLAVIEPQRYPFAVEALVQAAGHDPHPAVRIKAIQTLALIRADTPAVRQTLQLAARDADPRIREQAGYALQLLSAPASGVVPAGYTRESK
jgi:hypothetical protein